ncbi:MAG: hypothetical protein KAS78_04095 [Candidatus Pacebacteria bacterium]|nr:hypothetical protein [Candidatus Paceibacterota bacterium]
MGELLTENQSQYLEVEITRKDVMDVIEELKLSCKINRKMVDENNPNFENNLFILKDIVKIKRKRDCMCKDKPGFLCARCVVISSVLKRLS